MSRTRGAGRPIQYDRAAAIEATKQLFYEKGFKEASIQDVVAVTGMQTGSVYTAFGSKLQLFLECLDTELKQLAEQVDCCLKNTADPLDGLLRFWALGYGGIDKPSFDFLARVDFPDRESEAWQRTAAAWRECDQALQAAITAAQAAGQVRRDLSAAEIDRFVRSVMLGERYMRYYCDEPDGASERRSPEELILEFLRDNLTC